MFCTSSRWLLAGAGVLAGCARQHHASGVVIALNPPAGEVTISHRAIPGYMPAMSMPFRVVHPNELAPLTPGSRVQFDLKAGRVTKIRVDSGAPLDFPQPQPERPLKIGDMVPDFSLVDEHERAAHVSDFRGRLIAVEFIYTRCPLPDVCPRLSANFAYLQKKFGRDITLLSITVDPEHDTPAVLAEYAQRWRADPATWHFLTGPPPIIREVADHFGLVYFAEEGSITHTSSVALIGPQGQLVARLEGSSYTVKELADLVGANIFRRSQP